MTLIITLEWITEKLDLKEENLDNIKSLSLPGRYDEKISSLGSALVMFSRLKNLDLSRNSLSSLSGLESLSQLASLNLYYNCIDSLTELLKLRKNARLQQLDLRLNPVSRSEPDYRFYLIQMLPELKRLDDRSVADAERNSALLHFTSDQAAVLRGLVRQDRASTPSVIDDDTEDAASEPATSPLPPTRSHSRQQPQPSPTPPNPTAAASQGRDSAYSDWLTEVKAQGRWAVAESPPPQPQPRHQQSATSQATAAASAAATASRRFRSESYGSGSAAGDQHIQFHHQQQQQHQQQQLGDPRSSESSLQESENEDTAAAAAKAALNKSIEVAAAGERRSSLSFSLGASGGVPRLVLSDSGRTAGANQLGADKQRVLKKRLPRARWEKPPPPQAPHPAPASSGRKASAAVEVAPPESSAMSVPSQQLQCGSCPGLDLSKPCPFLNELASLAEKHWGGPGSLIRSRRFQEAGRAVLMQLAQFVRNEAASATAAEAVALNSRLAYLEQENTRLLREVGQLAASSGRPTRLQFESSLGYQKQQQQQQQEQHTVSQNKVDELAREVDRLKTKLGSLEQVELISSMLQESHKSLLLTNEHLMSELRLMRRREDGHDGSSVASSIGDLAKPSGYGGRKARDQSAFEESVTPKSSASSSTLHGSRPFGNGRQTSTSAGGGGDGVNGVGGSGGSLQSVGKSSGISAYADWR